MDNTVYISNAEKVDKHQRYHKLDFAVYGHVMTKDKRTYIASDINFNIFKIQGAERKKIRIMKPKDEVYGFYPEEMGLNMHLSNDDKKLLTGYLGNNDTDKDLKANIYNEYVPNDYVRVKYSNFLGVTLWDIEKGLPKHQYGGNAYKTNATLSPDGKYVVAGDENSRGFVWDANQGSKIFRLASLSSGVAYDCAPGHYHCKYDNSGMTLPPTDFCWKPNRFYRDCIDEESIIAMRFINNDQYFRFTHMIPYAILYNVLNPKPVKYLKLEGHPDVYGYSSAKSVATAPKAGILVMATNIANGIRVYKYNRKQQTLKLIWAPDEFETTRWQKFAWFWWPRFKKALAW